MLPLALALIKTKIAIFLIHWSLCSENAEEMASGEEARFWADLNQKYIT